MHGIIFGSHAPLTSAVMVTWLHIAQARQLISINNIKSSAGAIFVFGTVKDTKNGLYINWNYFKLFTYNNAIFL
jgi:hypothetical protein